MRLKVLKVLLVLFLAFLMPMSSYASSMTEDVSVQIIGGSLTVTPDNIEFQTTELDVSRTQTNLGSAVITIEDNRGSGTGWEVSVESTDWVAEVDDPTASGKTMKVSFDASSVTADGVVRTLKGLPNNVVVNEVTLGNTPKTLVHASPGYGMGMYEVELDLIMQIPTTVEVIEVESGSSYVEGQMIGTIASKYVSTWTFTTSNGI